MNQTKTFTSALCDASLNVRRIALCLIVAVAMLVAINPTTTKAECPEGYEPYDISNNPFRYIYITDDYGQTCRFAFEVCKKEVIGPYGPMNSFYISSISMVDEDCMTPEEFSF